MRKICSVVLVLNLWLALSAFSDPDGIYSIDIPSNWRIVSSRNGVEFARQGDSTQGFIWVNVVGPWNRSLKDFLHNIKSDSETVVQESNYTIGDQDGLYAETRTVNQRGVTVTGRWVLCYVPNRAAVFYIASSSGPNLLAENDRIFWQAVQSLRWGR